LNFRRKIESVQILRSSSIQEEITACMESMKFQQQKFENSQTSEPEYKNGYS
jgi:hypothetical protein